MTRIFSTLTIIIFILFSGITLITAQTSNGVGVSPAYFNNQQLSQGSVFSQEYVISRANTTEEIIAVIDVQMNAATSWFKVEPSNRITMPKGQNRVNMKISVSVPANASFQKYNGVINVKLEGKETTGKVNLTPAVQLKADITITDQKTGILTVTNSRIPDIAQNDNLILIADVENKGNAEAEFTSMQLKVMSLDKKELFTIDAKDKVAQKGFTRSELPIDFGKTNLKAGDYFAEVSLKSSTLDYKNQLSFKVTEAKSFTDNLLSGQFFQTIDHNIIYPIGFFALLILILIIIIVSKRRKKQFEQKKTWEEVYY